MAKSQDPEEDLEEKARKLWGDPERELDEYDLKLARLQAELDDEDTAKQRAAAESREQAEAREPAPGEAMGGTESPEARGPASPGKARGTRPSSSARQAEDDTSESLVDRGKRQLGERADEAAREVAAEAMKGGDVKEAALTVVKRRLPSLPSRAQFRNAALGVAGAGVGLWLLWGILAPIFGWAWWLAKWGLVGGVGYGAYRTYQMLPDRGGSEVDGAADEAADDEDDEPTA